MGDMRPINGDIYYADKANIMSLKHLLTNERVNISVKTGQEDVGCFYQYRNLPLSSGTFHKVSAAEAYRVLAEHLERISRAVRWVGASAVNEVEQIRGEL